MRNIPGTNIIIRFCFVGDEAFPLKPNLMRPFPRRELDFGKAIFNGQLSNTRQTVERAFGLLTKKFGIFQRGFETNVDMIKSACVVHKYIIKTQAREEALQVQDKLKDSLAGKIVQ